jgi:DNA-binding NtrC family response regulator
VFEITLPPLRDRRDDIPLLAEAFMQELGSSVGRPAAGLSEEARDHLLRYPWPGNVRELRNAIERAIILCDGGLVTSQHLPTAVSVRSAAAPTSQGSGSLPAGITLEGVERDLVRQALANARNNKSLAAKLLGVPRGQFYSLLRRHGLTDARR